MHLILSELNELKGMKTDVQNLLTSLKKYVGNDKKKRCCIDCRQEFSTEYKRYV